MSAYVCNPEHIAALGAALAREGVTTSNSVPLLLLSVNIRAVRDRYPSVSKFDQLPGVTGTATEMRKQVERLADDPRILDGLSDADLLNMAACYAYQTSEHRLWGTEDFLVRVIIDDLTTVLAARIVASGNSVDDARETATVCWHFAIDIADFENPVTAAVAA